MNLVILTGRLTKDPEIKFLPGSGKAVINIDLAVDRDGLKDSQGNKITDFHHIVIWGKTAENLNNYCQKGDLIGVQGILQNRDYENQKGEKKHITEINASKVDFLHLKGKNNNQPLQQNYAPQQSYAPQPQQSYAPQQQPQQNYAPQQQPQQNYAPQQQPQQSYAPQQQPQQSYAPQQQPQQNYAPQPQPQQSYAPQQQPQQSYAPQPQPQQSYAPQQQPQQQPQQNYAPQPNYYSEGIASECDDLTPIDDGDIPF